MPYNSGSKKGQLNRCDVKKLWIEKTGESPPTSWNRDKIMSELEKKKENVQVKEARYQIGLGMFYFILWILSSFLIISFFENQK